MKGLLDRSLSRFPRPVRTAVDWAVTLVVAVAVVLVFEAEVAKPYRIPTSSMEPTLHCARPGDGCLGDFSDRVIVSRVTYRLRDPRRGDIVVFDAPPAAAASCGFTGTYVKRVIGVPGDTVAMNEGYVSVNGARLDERAYIRTRAQRGDGSGAWKVPPGRYFLMGDNRAESCDSRVWGPVARSRLIGPVLGTYWPPTRIH